jgi:hypothetical protein
MLSETKEGSEKTKINAHLGFVPVGAVQDLNSLNDIIAIIEKIK